MKSTNRTLSFLTAFMVVSLLLACGGADDSSDQYNNGSDNGFVDTNLKWDASTSKQDVPVVDPPCEGGNWLNGHYKCCNQSGKMCSLENCESAFDEFQCKFSSCDVVNSVTLNPPPDSLKLNPPSGFKVYFDKDSFVICIKISQ